MRVLISIISTIAGLIQIFGIYSWKIVWILVGIVPLVIIALLLFFKRRNLLAKAKIENNAAIEQLKTNGKRISLDFDQCENKDSSYSQDLIDERMTRMSQLNLDYGKVIGTEFTGQSLLVYNYSNGDETEKFVQPFPFGAETLRVYLIRNWVTLYVDRKNRSKYFFDLKVE